MDQVDHQAILNNRVDRYGLRIASVMVCNEPHKIGNRLFCSADSSVWKNVSQMKELKKYFTDSVGVSDFWEGDEGRDDLQMIDEKAIYYVGKYRYFCCFRAVFEADFNLLQVIPPEMLYKKLMPELCFLGWDVCTGNSFISASCHGVFPINPFDGQVNDTIAINLINNFGLFFTSEGSRLFCNLNNSEIREHRPWYPVGVFTDKNSFMRMTQG